MGRAVVARVTLSWGPRRKDQPENAVSTGPAGFDRAERLRNCDNAMSPNRVQGVAKDASYPATFLKGLRNVRTDLRVGRRHVAKRDACRQIGRGRLSNRGMMSWLMSESCVCSPAF